MDEAQRKASSTINVSLDDIATSSRILSPFRGDEAGSGVWLSYRPAKLNRPAGRYDNQTPEAALSPSQGEIIGPLHTPQQNKKLKLTTK
jgi:hypothetical protein